MSEEQKSIRCEYCGATAAKCPWCGTPRKIIEVIDVFHILERCKGCHDYKETESCPDRTQ